MISRFRVERAVAEGHRVAGNPVRFGAAQDQHPRADQGSIEEQIRALARAARMPRAMAGGHTGIVIARILPADFWLGRP